MGSPASRSAPSGRVGFLSHSACYAHDPGPGAPESSVRLKTLDAHLDRTGLRTELATEDVPLASMDAMLRVHAPAYLDRVRHACEAGHSFVDSPDATCSTITWEAAQRAAGAGMLAVDRVVDGDWSAGFCAVRPPGHHAEEGLSMGFCFVNSIAVAARHAQAVHGLERVAIIDWDVHHGNGTQHLFEADPSVLYASLHQSPHYPGTGAANERGLGAGEGATLNLPQQSGTGDAEWLGAFESTLLPTVEAFAPDLILISAGFDAHMADPLSGTRLTEDGFAQMTRGLRDVAGRTAKGRIVSMLEGGYDPDALARSVQAHLEALR
jgi:acetoin utilization deacetylase AcuC-like enzyme